MRSSDLARHAQPLIDGGVAPTLAIGVFDGQATHRFEHGVSADALFEIGSITKVFTGTLLADLAREGLVDLDDPVARRLPASVRVPQFGDRVMTLRHLATHTSGLPASSASSSSALGEFARLAADGKLTVPVARTFALEDWRTALGISSSRQARGKLVLLTGGRRSSAGV